MAIFLEQSKLVEKFPRRRTVALGLKSYDKKYFYWGNKISSSVISDLGTKNCSLVDSAKGNV